MFVKKYQVVKIIKDQIQSALFRESMQYSGSPKLNYLINKAADRFMKRYAGYQNSLNYDEQHRQALDELQIECQKLTTRIIDGKIQLKIRRTNGLRTVRALISNALRQCGLVFFCNL